MVAEFLKVVEKLPKVLNKETQYGLFREMARLKEQYLKSGDSTIKTQYYRVRDELISHNLKLSADFAIKYCRRYDMAKDVEDLYGECIIAMVKAVDSYDVERGFDFSTLAYNYMEMHLLKLYGKKINDASSKVSDIDILVRDEDFVENGNFYFFYDKDESSIAEDFASDDFIQDIVKYIDSNPDKKTSIAFKMALGLGGYKKHKYEDISKLLNISQTAVSLRISKQKRSLIQYIANNYPQYVFLFKDLIAQPPMSFANNEERDKYIFNSYYGIEGCTKKNITQLAQEVGFKDVGSVSRAIGRVRKSMSEEDLNLFQAQHQKRNRQSRFDDKFCQEIAEDFYGLNGKKMLDSGLILKKYNITSSSRFHIVSRYLNAHFTKEQCEALYARRALYEKWHKLRVCEYSYNSYYGLNNLSKKSQWQLAEELGVLPEAIQRYIKKYKDYLNLSDEEKQVILAEDFLREQD